MRYFGVVGNRDHIKIDGDKQPFHEFLDVQPDGWLTSLVYVKGFTRPNDNPMIFDCGAWSYRNDDMPPVTAKECVDKYTNICNSGDICVAPDHMLMPDCDVHARQAWNEKSAKEFLQELPKHLKPMGIVHGINDTDRETQAARYFDMGYRHIGVGGIAARASSPTYCLDQVARVRHATPNAYLHVMGLSSPNYFAEWARLGVDSCDGSSHFKQAFTGGAFFSLDWKGKLVKHQAARRDNESRLPDVHCDCGVCETMRGQGIDTRSYGSNENNMGRAVHNLNMLMVAQKAKTRGIQYLVSCVSQKAAEPSVAKKLYTSTWFEKARKIAEEYGESWLILSAKHHVVGPLEVIKPYEKTLDKNTRRWARKVADDVIAENTGQAVFILAGNRYRKDLIPLLHAAGIPTYTPLSGLGIGQQLAAMTPDTSQQELKL